MKKNIIFFTFLLIIGQYRSAFAVGQANTEQLIRKINPPLAVLKEEEPEKDRWSVDSYYEHSKVIQGSRPGRWKEITNRLGYTHRNIQAYTTLTQWQRYDVKNYNAYAGSYINFPSSYLHMELGWGWDTTYMYKFQSIAEYGHKMFKDLFWQAGYTYRHYSTDDNHIIYPGLIYYFGDSYIACDYGLSLIESRGTAGFGTIRGNFALGQRFSLLLGAAAGERLYDIYGLPASKEYGYIFFTGVNYNFCKWMSAKVGFSYGTEKPDFIKRSLDMGVSLKF